MIKPSQETVRVIDSAAICPEIPLVEGVGNVKVLLWPGNGAEFRSFQVLELGKGAQTVPLCHGSDCVYYVMTGKGRIVDLSNEQNFELAEGAMVHIDSGDSYYLKAADGVLTILGGPCPPDEALYSCLKFPKG